MFETGRVRLYMFVTPALFLISRSSTFASPAGSVPKKKWQLGKQSFAYLDITQIFVSAHMIAIKCTNFLNAEGNPHMHAVKCRREPRK